MLPKANRLSYSRDFDRLYRKRQRVKIGELIIHYQLSRNEASRLGFVVSKKVAQKANRRNYLKRVLRAVFAGLPNDLKIGYDMIISLAHDPAKQTPARKPYESFTAAKNSFVSRFK